MKKTILAGISALLLMAAIPAAVLAQDNAPAGIGQKNVNLGQIKQKIQGKFNELSFEELKSKLIEQIGRAEENLNQRLNHISENEEMEATVKQQLTDLIKAQIAKLPSYKEQANAATDKAGLKTVMQAMAKDVKEVRQFMEQNRPSKEEMQQKWDILKLDEKKVKISSNLDKRIEELQAIKAKVNAATTEEELKEIGNPGLGFGSMGFKKPGKGARGNENPGRGPMNGEKPGIDLGDAFEE